MTALLAPRRPRWRNLALLALLLAPLLWPLQQLAERYYRNELTEQNRQTRPVRRQPARHAQPLRGAAAHPR